MALFIKRIIAVLLLMTLISVSGCKGTDPVASTASSSAASSEQTSPTADGYKAVYSDKICDEDRDNIQRLCTEMCYRWAQMFYGKSDRDFADLTEYEDLNTYLTDFAHNGTIEGSFIDLSAFFDVESLDITGSQATVKGRYKMDNGFTEGSTSIYIFIIDNCDGVLKVNDMISTDRSGYDALYRSELISAPEADYWKDHSRLEKILSAK